MTSLPTLQWSVPSVLSDYSPAPSMIEAKKEDPRAHRIIHKAAQIFGKIELASHCYIGHSTLRGDICTLRIPVFVVIEDQVVLQPTVTVKHGHADPVTTSIGSYVWIGKGSCIEAMHIGRFVMIESNCVVGAGSSIGNGVWLRSGSTVLPGTVLAPFSVYSGSPATCVGQLSEDTHPFELREMITQQLLSVHAIDSQQYVFFFLCFD